MAPGEKVEINVETKPNSFVALLGIDEKSALLKSGNDIDETKILEEIKSFYFQDVLGTKRRNDSYTLLSESNAMLITDATTGKPNCHSRSSTSNLHHNRRKRNVDDDSTDGNSGVKAFSEGNARTLIFESFKTDSSGQKTLQQVVPELFTSYIITGFSIHPQLGLSLAAPKKIGVFKKFFIELHTPRNIIAGDVLKVKVVIFNFLKIKRVTVELKKNEENFEIVEKVSAGSTCHYRLNNSSMIEIEAQVRGATPAYFYIRPLTEGTLKLEVEASATGATAIASKLISIAREGLEQSGNKAKFVDLRSRRYDGHYFDMSNDDNAVTNSIQAEASVIGDLMGPALENIEELLKDVPLDSAEHQMIKFMPTVIALNYLKAIDRLTDSKKRAGIKNLETGYTFISSKKLSGKDNGAYQLIRGPASTGNIALTAYVSKYLALTKEWIEIDDRLITDALNFLKKKQGRDGKFTAEALSDEAFPSELSDDVVSTAFVSIAFLENTQYVDRYQTVIDRSFKFIDSKFRSIENNPYALAISAYALALGKNSAAEKFLNKLMEQAKKDRIGHHWDVAAASESTKVEIASYAILAHVFLEQSVEAKPILDWLTSKRNREGGFFTPKDTIVGLQAVAEMAKHLFSSNFDMDIYFLYGEPSETINANINEKNKIDYRKFIIPTNEGVSLQANGTGVAYVQVWQKFYLKPENRFDRFKIAITKNGNGRKLQLEICITGRASKLTVAEIKLPSGYEFNNVQEKLVSTACHMF